MAKALSLIIFCLAFLFYANGQNYKEKYDDLPSSKDSEERINFLQEWEKSAPDDPELYTSYFNYYVNKARQELIEINSIKPNDRESLEITPEGEENSDPTAYLYSQVYYDYEPVFQGLKYIDEGIKRHPNRLDMRFGKIYILGESKDYESFTSEIIKTINHSAKNNNQWLWTNNEIIQNAEENFFDAIQDYVVTLYNTNDDDLLENVRLISEEIIKHYPNNTVSLSNISIVYIITERYDKALKFALKAEKVSPDDTIILNNIAYIYKTIASKDEAIEYYKKVIKFGDEEEIEFARQQITELEND